jgi:hypothetical protein
MSSKDSIYLWIIQNFEFQFGKMVCFLQVRQLCSVILLIVLTVCFKKIGKSTRYLPVLLSYREMCQSLGPSALDTYKKCIHFWPFWRKGAVFNKYLWSIHAYVFAKDKFRRKNQISTVQNHIEFLRCTYFCFLRHCPEKNNCKSTYTNHVGF